MARRDSRQEGGGCLGLFAALVVIALVVMAVISLAAVVDPFGWLPPVDEIWRDCQDNYATDRDECALANRFPGFWGHVVVNLLYAVAAAGALATTAVAARSLPKSRGRRFDGADELARYRADRRRLLAGAACSALVAVIPPLVAALS